jgi:hypothetical protein
MTPHSVPDGLEKIFQYTSVAANALQDVAATTQIPFLDIVCTAVLRITPLVEVCSCDAEFLVLSQFDCRISSFRKADAFA